MLHRSQKIGWLCCAKSAKFLFLSTYKRLTTTLATESYWNGCTPITMCNYITISFKRIKVPLSFFSQYTWRSKLMLAKAHVEKYKVNRKRAKLYPVFILLFYFKVIVYIKSPLYGPYLRWNNCDYLFLFITKNFIRLHILDICDLRLHWLALIMQTQLICWLISSNMHWHKS